MTVGPRGERGSTGESVEPGRFPREVRIQFWLVVLVSALMLTVIAWNVRENRNLARQGAEAHDTLCAIKENNERRYARTQRILESTDGPLIFGIPRNEIEKGQRDLALVVREMERLDCVPPPVPVESLRR